MQPFRMRSSKNAAIGVAVSVTEQRPDLAELVRQCRVFTFEGPNASSVVTLGPLDVRDLPDGAISYAALDALSDLELQELHRECAADADSLRVLEAYLDRRLGTDWRSTQQQPPPRGPRTDMTHDEALAVLGLAEGATPDEIRAAHRRLIQRMHPDVGGTADLAARINRAKDVLLGG